jgi:uncharacterized protein YfeS
MKKRIKKKQLYMKLEDVCESIVETIPVPDHSTLVMRLAHTKMHANFGFKSEWNKLVRIAKSLKRNHDIDVVTVPANMFDVVYSGGRIPHDKLMEKIKILESGAPVVVKPVIVDGQEISLDASVQKDLKRG